MSTIVFALIAPVPAAETPRTITVGSISPSKLSAVTVLSRFSFIKFVKNSVLSPYFSLLKLWFARTSMLSAFTSESLI